jgi:hypothetical protein
MSELPRPMFVARDTYRARRTMDAARLLPLLGMILLLGFLPLLRVKGGGAEVGGSSSGTMLFMFAVWVLLIAVAAWMARPLREIDQADSKPLHKD